MHAERISQTIGGTIECPVCEGTGIAQFCDDVADSRGGHTTDDYEGRCPDCHGDGAALCKDCGECASVERQNRVSLRYTYFCGPCYQDGIDSAKEEARDSREDR